MINLFTNYLADTSLKTLKKRGVNISRYLRKRIKTERNTPAIIRTCYELQAGEDTAFAVRHEKYLKKWSHIIADEIKKLSLPRTFSLLEAGVGEATTFAHVLGELNGLVSFALGCDISPSRLALARDYLNMYRLNDSVFFIKAELSCLPLLDNSVDVIYTSHAIEPNGGRETAILKELYRVSSRYLVLVEPSYYFATTKARRRMRRHGYITRLPEAAAELDYNVIKHARFPLKSKPSNPSSMLVIEKSGTGEFLKLQDK